MNAELKNALASAFKTVANVKSNDQARLCGSQAVDYWIREHLGREWHLINIGLTLITNEVSAERSFLTRKAHGILQQYSFSHYTKPSTLWVYEADRYTEKWVHELIENGATGNEDNRILCIERNDEDTILDLGSLKLGD